MFGTERAFKLSVFAVVAAFGVEVFGGFRRVGAFVERGLAVIGGERTRRIVVGVVFRGRDPAAGTRHVDGALVAVQVVDARAL